MWTSLLIHIIAFADICISCSQEIPHAPFTPAIRTPSALPAAPLFSIPPTPGSPPSIHSQHPTVSNALCNQSIKPSTSPACSGVSVLIPGTAMPLQSVASPHTTADISKPNDDIMQIMHQLISQDYHTANSTNIGGSPKHPSHFVMNPVADSQSANSPYLADVAANSPASDRPQYSPITPSDSPSGRIYSSIFWQVNTVMYDSFFHSTGMPTYPDQMLYSLKQKKKITESDFLVCNTCGRCYSNSIVHYVRSFSSVCTGSITLQLFKPLRQLMVMKM